MKTVESIWGWFGSPSEKLVQCALTLTKHELKLLEIDTDSGNSSPNKPEKMVWLRDMTVFVSDLDNYQLTVQRRDRSKEMIFRAMDVVGMDEIAEAIDYRIQHCKKR